MHGFLLSCVFLPIPQVCRVAELAYELVATITLHGGHGSGVGFIGLLPLQ